MFLSHALFDCLNIASQSVSRSSPVGLESSISYASFVGEEVDEKLVDNPKASTVQTIGEPREGKRWLDSEMLCRGWMVKLLRLVLMELDRRKHFAMIRCYRQRSWSDNLMLLYLEDEQKSQPCEGRRFPHLDRRLGRTRLPMVEGEQTFFFEPFP